MVFLKFLVKNQSGPDYMNHTSAQSQRRVLEPDVLAQEIIENLEAGIESFKEIYEALE